MNNKHYIVGGLTDFSRTTVALKRLVDRYVLFKKKMFQLFRDLNHFSTVTNDGNIPIYRKHKYVYGKLYLRLLFLCWSRRSRTTCRPVFFGKIDTEHRIN